MNSYETIKKFIQIHHLDERNPNVLGIIFYGSTKYQTNKPNSDIDLLVVTNSSRCYKGVTYIDGIKVEYFEKNFNYLLNQIHDIKNSLDYSLLSIFKNGEILFSKDYALEYLVDEVLYQNITPTKNRSVNYAVLNEWLCFFRNIAPESPLFLYTYHNLLEFIRKIFHEKKGLSKLPATKIYELYQNKRYATDFYCVTLPPQQFRELFLDLMTQGYQSLKFQALLSTISPKEGYHKISSHIYQPNELKYKSTIVETCVSKAIVFINEKHPASLHYYYIALEKLRVLYCNINNINDSINQFGNFYDAEFLLLFQDCLNQTSSNSLTNLFAFVTSSLQMNYHNYKVFEYHI